MSASRTCDRRILAQAPGYRVERCSCGLIHVYTGPITLNMEPAACESFTTLLAKAMAALAKLRKQEARPAIRLIARGDLPSGATDRGES